MAGEHSGEVGIAPGGEHRQRVTDDPQHQAGDGRHEAVRINAAGAC
jgi:hypothetical protein